MEYLVHLAIIFAIYAMLGISLNLVVGYTGLLSVTHAAFYGIGAYAAAILLTRAGVNFFAALGAGMIMAAVISFLVGLILSRFKNDYYALVSFGFNVIVYSVMLNWQSLTRGPLGIPGIPRPRIFGIDFFNNVNFLLLTAVFAAAVYFSARCLVNSSAGRVLKAIRENELTAKVLGYRANYYKLFIFVAGAVLAAVAGGFFGAYITYVDPSSFTLSESIYILSIIILGGLANLGGSVWGALFLVLLPEGLRFVGFPDAAAAQLRQLVYGLILVLLMLYRPQGLKGEFKL